MAPKVDVRVVIAGVITFVSVFQVRGWGLLGVSVGVPEILSIFTDFGGTEMR